VSASKAMFQRQVGRFDFFKKRFLRRLSIGAKLWLNTAILALPVLGLGYFYVESLSSTYYFTKTEQQGMGLFQPAARIGHDLAVHEAALAAGASAEAASAAQSMDGDFTELQRIDAAGGNAGTHAKVQELGTRLAAAKTSGAGDSHERHQAAIDAAAAVRAQVGADWLLVLDPESSAYNLIDVALMKLPDLDRNLGDVRTHLSGLAAAGRAAGPEAYDLNAAITLVRDRLGAAHDELVSAHESAGDRQALQQEIASLGDKWVAPYATLLDDATAVLKTGQAGPDALHKLEQRAATLHSDAGQLQLKAFGLASDALALRGATQYHGAVLALVGSAIAMIAAVATMLMLARRISGAITRLLGITERIADGQFDTVIDRSGDDEISRLFDGVAGMQQRLLDERDRELAANAQLRDAAIINQRIRQALESVGTCVMVADAEHNIIFANRHLLALLTESQADVRKSLPAFDASKVVGSSMDVFHRSPVHQRQMLGALSAPHTMTLKFAARTFRLTASPVIGDDGARLGTVVEWLDRTQEDAVEREVAGIVTAVGGGDLSQRINVSGKTGFFEVLSKGINGLVDDFTTIVTQVKAAAGEVNRGASEISTGNANLARRTEEQASSLEQTASSMEQMTSTVKQNADNAGQANQLAVAARDQADKGGAVVARAAKAMSEINTSSRRIADITGVIDEIAFQTNLLALNAAVEAARAGEQGRGFAVVASEVRSLAGRSAAAAKEIKGLIQDSVRKVDEGSVLVSQSGATLDEIVAAVKKVGDIVAEIAAASHEQSSGIEEVNKAVMQLDELTQQNAALVEQAMAASRSMAEQAQGLAEMMTRFETGAPASEGGARRVAVLPAQRPAVPGRTPAPRATGPARKATGTDGGAQWSEF
jgi:methyl-accepting chemotaxis protein